MIKLVPAWAHDYDEFWATIRRRNRWFIRLRYIAVAGLAGFLLVGEFLLSFKLTPFQIYSIITITLLIFGYNVIIQVIRPKIKCIPGEFNCMHLSLVQMILDLTALMILVYITGIKESPLYGLFIFHMIIGSLILPGYLIYMICGIIIAIYVGLIFLQHLNLVGNHIITGLYETVPVNLITHDIIFSGVFIAMMSISVFIANVMARNLLRREKQLRETFQELKDTEIAKQKYIIAVVHEIKTPLAAVHSMVDLIYQNFLGPVNEKVSEKLTRIKLRLDDALNLINDVLRISKLRLLNISSSEEINLEELISIFKEKEIEKLQAEGIELEIIDGRDDKSGLYGDRVLLELAISNILNNSVKYIGREKRIVASMCNKEDYIELIVEDTGIGIPEKDLDKIFEQFYRASNIKKVSIEGTGIGLSLVKEIIERHGGAITITSPSSIGDNENPGTRVMIKLPRKAHFVNPLEDKQKRINKMIKT
jgi:signal transduction histidine kinase